MDIIVPHTIGVTTRRIESRYVLSNPGKTVRVPIRSIYPAMDIIVTLQFGVGSHFLAGLGVKFQEGVECAADASHLWVFVHGGGSAVRCGQGQGVPAQTRQEDYHSPLHFLQQG